MPDNPIEQVHVDIAAAQNQHHALALQFVLDLERARERGCASAFGKELQPLEQEQHGLADFEVIDGDDAFDPSAHDLEWHRADASGRRVRRR